MKYSAFFATIILFSGLIFADVTIHIYNPWIENPYRQDSLYISGIAEVGYHPGTLMHAEGNGWYYYSIEESFHTNSTVTFRSYIGNQYDEYAMRANFPDTSTDGIALNAELLDAFPGYDEFWIIPVDSLTEYNIYVEPPEGKVIHLMNPWPNNSPQILVGGNPARKMRVNTQICGWYTYFFSGFIDSLQSVLFTDYYHTSQYGTDGLSGGSPIDLSSHLAENDTIYILPRPFPRGAPSFSTNFPGRTGECPTREISALVRDWEADGVSFFTGGITGGKVTPGMVEEQLGADGKPVKGPNASDAYGEELESWFVTQDDNEACVNLTLTKGYDGLWEYDSDLFGGFFPIDTFDHPNNVKYEDSHEIERNFLFTMEMHLQFVYHQGSGQEFVFRGDDDVWIFVNNRLAIDLGGMHMRASDTLIMDDLAPVLGLEDQGNYAMDIFFAERQPVHSNFLVRTSLDLRNSEELFYYDNQLAPGNTRYDIMQRVGQEGLDCGFTPLMNEEEPAVVEYFLEGPEFTEPYGPLSWGEIHFGGVHVDSSSVTIDSAAVDGLVPGEYVLTFRSIYDEQRQGYLSFTVAGKIPANLYADPPTGTHFIQDTSVTLTTDEGARIYFTTDGSEPDTTDESQLYREPIILDATTNIQAIAVGDEYLPSSGSWAYTRDAVAITLTANPADSTHFFGDTTIVLSSQPQARIYYTIDGSVPDTTDESQLYSDPFTIHNTAQVNAIAVGDYLQTANAVWHYIRDLPDAQLIADPEDGTHFGSELLVTLTTDADAIYFTTDGSDPIAGNDDQLYSEPFLISGDTVSVRAIAVGREFNSTTDQWTYICDRVPGVQAIPFGRQFSERISVMLAVADSDAEIYYTLDGSEPTQNSTRYDDPVELTTTTQLRARAFAPDKLPSNILVETYTRVSVAENAFYYDANGDGSVDSFSVNLDYAASECPDTLVLINPFRNNERVALGANQLNLAPDGMSLSAVWPGFGFDELTGFPAGLFARFGGADFDNELFLVSDRVAPVITSAIIRPTLLTADMEVICTLSVTFSENIETINTNLPFNFYRGQESFYLDLELLSQSSNRAHFVGYSLEGIEYMQTGDLISIQPDQGISDLSGNNQNNPQNRRVPMRVMPQPYKIDFVCSPNPFIPGVSELALEKGGLGINQGTAIVADFRGNLGSKTVNVGAKISIYDCTNNLICSAGDRGLSSLPVQFDVITGRSTKLVFLWNGRNSRGREVGEGTYVAVVSITDPSNITTVKKIPIGIEVQ
ncbi:MAG: chitobiase/beta-hexosaminidase C-terminal domain-containing protein [Chitinispirillaceae bacterium]